MIFTGEWNADNAIMTTILDEIDFYSGTERKKMLKVSPKEGGSMLFGTTWRSYLSPTKNRTYDPETGKYRTKVYDDYPELRNIFKEFADYHLPNFTYTQVQMNKNFPCPPHRDSQNITSSILCCFGDYIGGLTCVDINKKIKKLDCSLRPEEFNGAEHIHWVEPYKGTRYSLVFFNKIK